MNALKYDTLFTGKNLRRFLYWMCVQGMWDTLELVESMKFGGIRMYEPLPANSPMVKVIRVEVN